MFRLAHCALALLVVLASVTLPACGGICCPKAAEASVHAEMPCCAGASAMTPREASPAQPATFARVATPIAVLTRPAAFAESPALVRSAPHVDRETPHEPTPPLFLMNAQVLL